jgi:hypothetical protein
MGVLTSSGVSELIPHQSLAFGISTPSEGFKLFIQPLLYISLAFGISVDILFWASILSLKHKTALLVALGT